MKKLVFLTGAGMSSESGIKTFRDSGGLWEEYDVAEVARRLGGGGHRNAAGCKFRNGETMQDVRDQIFALLLPLVEG